MEDVTAAVEVDDCVNMAHNALHVMCGQIVSDVLVLTAGEHAVEVEAIDDGARLMMVKASMFSAGTPTKVPANSLPSSSAASLIMASEPSVSSPCIAPSTSKSLAGLAALNDDHRNLIKGQVGLLTIVDETIRTVATLIHDYIQLNL